MVTNPCFQTLLLSKAVLLGRKASLSGLRRAFVRSLDRPLDQSVVWPAMLVRIRACLFLFFRACLFLFTAFEAAGAEVIVYFETLSTNRSADEQAVNDFLQGRLVLLGGIGFCAFKLID